MKSAPFKNAISTIANPNQTTLKAEPTTTCTAGIDTSHLTTFNILLVQGFQGVLGTRFGTLEVKIGSVESEKIIVRSLELEKIGSLESENRVPFSLKKTEKKLC